MKVAYLASQSPEPIDRGAKFRIASLYAHFSAQGETRLFLFGDRPPLGVRRSLLARGASFFPARRERGRLALLARCVAMSVRGRSIPAGAFLTPARIERLVRELRAFAPDLIVLDDTYLAELVAPLSALGRPIVASTHNAESLLLMRILRGTRRVGDLVHYGLMAANAAMLERRYLARADRVWAVSEADAAYFGRRGLTQVKVVPNALDLRRYVPCEEDGGEPTLVFAGIYNFKPNADAAMALITVSDRLLARGVRHRLVLVGSHPRAEMLAAARTRPHVQVTGHVEDAIAWIGRATVFVAPLRSGSGTKLKILEAMALGRPVVTTAIGAEGLPIEDGVHAVLAESTGQCADSVATLLADPAARARLGAAGRALVERAFSWEALGPAIEAGLAGLVPLGVAP